MERLKESLFWWYELCILETVMPSTIGLTERCSKRFYKKENKGQKNERENTDYSNARQ